MIRVCDFPSHDCSVSSNEIQTIEYIIDIFSWEHIKTNSNNNARTLKRCSEWNFFVIIFFFTRLIRCICIIYLWDHDQFKGHWHCAAHSALADRASFSAWMKCNYSESQNKWQNDARRKIASDRLTPILCAIFVAFSILNETNKFRGGKQQEKTKMVQEFSILFVHMSRERSKCFESCPFSRFTRIPNNNVSQRKTENEIWNSLFIYVVAVVRAGKKKNIERAWKRRQ